MKRFENKVVIITGGSGQIGFTTAKRMGSEGAKILLVDIDEESLKEKEKEAKESNYEMSYTVADVTKPEDVERYVETAIERYGKIDMFFNNAGIEGVVQPIPDYPVDMFDKVLAVNVKGVFLGMKYVIPKIEDGGSIVITSSVAGLTGTAGMVAYNTSKHATIGIMRVAAKELADRKIRVNTVHPGVVDSRMMRSLEEGINPGHGDAVKEKFVEMIPLGRYAKPKDVSDMVTFLFSDESSYVHGSQFVVDGGFTEQ
ncbi:SDR family NAD(P)-dependent oxidoreductase [Algoriphagus antarcticus]|uniref:NAD(P)-dependent dehydrogenase (Short-subunit alcohol dehydrogenase family) n=1 Tax=Algoriphagus antarcticus TaxID=238540 RepID=A0A3E0E7Y1_9BACT|nr:SDR family NAD(P)-dependent oxidoreductase [Algoriphagus antarcticus]REG94347.1 NAD(P)-dependent dehydrogenase (short-subunit alcohol dehydrogenase family) [Algoriphagus antarcticus]